MSLPRRIVIGLAVVFAAGVPNGSAVAAPSPHAIGLSSWLQGWPMEGHDPQRTSRSPDTGPLHPHLLFTRKQFYAAIVGSDGAIYGWTPGQASLVALDSSGQLRWAVNGCCQEGYPTLAPDGMFFDTGGLTGSQTLSQPGKGNGTVAIAVRPDGSVAWTIAPFGVAKGSVALLSEDNLFYAPIHGPHNGTGSEPYIGLNVVSPQGQVIRHMPQTFYTPALGNDGTIYDESPLKAIDPSGRVLWMRRMAATVGPLIGRHGTIYVGEGTALAAYTPSGRLRWRLRWRDNTLALAERADGDLLVAGRTRLATVRPDGRRLWSVRIRKSAGRNVDRSLIVDAAGTSYVGTDDGKLRIISRNGRPVTTLSVGPNNQAAAIAPRSILGPDGRLLVNGIDGVLRVYGP